MATVSVSATKAPPATRAVVIAHRGASAQFPEHTLAAYQRAIDDGADFIEPDLVMSRDGVLISRHENEISGTTDVAQRPEFADRRTRKRIDGRTVEGWFTEDFTLAELKTLRARERLPAARGTVHDGQQQILTFDEIIALADAQSAAQGRVIGLIPEIKHPTHFRQLGLPIEEKLLATLRAHPFTRTAPVVIQSFEVGNLKSLRQSLPGDQDNIRLLQLIGRRSHRPADQASDGLRYRDMLTPQGLAAIAGYADIIGPEIRAVIPLTPSRRLGRPTTLIRDAHAAGLCVQPYTFRPENRYQARNFRHGSAPDRYNREGAIAEIRAYLDAGVDGFFTDDPGIGREAVDGVRLPTDDANVLPALQTTRHNDDRPQPCENTSELYGDPSGRGGWISTHRHHARRCHMAQGLPGAWA